MTEVVTPDITAPFPSAEHIAALRELVHDPKQNYAVLTPDQRWQWHAYDYGWQRIFRFVERAVNVSPLDPDGKWFNGLMADRAEAFWNEVRNAAREQRKMARGEELIREGRDKCNRWAREHGYRDFEEAYAAGRTYTEVAIAEIAHGQAELARKLGRDPAVRGTKFQSLASALGVKAREYTAEEMAEGRKQVGIE